MSQNRVDPFEFHCRHYSCERLNRICAKGHKPDDLARRMTPEQQLALGSFPRAWPCTSGCREGLFCADYSAKTAEERKADHDSIMGALEAVVAGHCTCGASLKRQGAAFVCSKPCDNPVSGFACGPKDIRT